MAPSAVPKLRLDRVESSTSSRSSRSMRNSSGPSGDVGAQHERGVRRRGKFEWSGASPSASSTAKWNEAAKSPANADASTLSTDVDSAWTDSPLADLDSSRSFEDMAELHSSKRSARRSRGKDAERVPRMSKRADSSWIGRGAACGDSVRGNSKGAAEHESRSTRAQMPCMDAGTNASQRSAPGLDASQRSAPGLDASQRSAPGLDASQRSGPGLCGLMHEAVDSQAHTQGPAAAANPLVLFVWSDGDPKAERAPVVPQSALQLLTAPINPLSMAPLSTTPGPAVPAFDVQAPVTAPGCWDHSGSLGVPMPDDHRLGLMYPAVNEGDLCAMDAYTSLAMMQLMAQEDTEVHHALPCLPESLRLDGPPGLFVAEPSPPSHEPGQWLGDRAPISPPLSPRELFAISEVEPVRSTLAPPAGVEFFPVEAAGAPRHIEEPDPPRHVPGQFDARFTPRMSGGSITPSATPREFFSMSTPPSSPKS